MRDLPSACVERFRAAIAGCLGLAFDETRLSFLAEVLRHRTEAEGCELDLYLGRLESGNAPQRELREIARDVTIGETYFFRHREQLRAFAETALVELQRTRPDGAPVRILSAGCATGEEPYSIAILARERGVPVSVRAIDVNAGSLERAVRGRYSSWSLRETEASFHSRYFAPDGREFLLDREIRAAVAFEERNLAADNPDLWQPRSLDLVLCRNVIMYFTPEAARRLVARIAQALAPGGYLFLGHAETLRGLSHDFHLRHEEGTFYYRRKEEDERSGIEPSRSARASSWFESIERSAERIRDLSRHGAEPRPTGSAPEARTASGWTGALQLLTEERFSEALSVLGTMPDSAAADPEVLLLRAVLFTQSGEIGSAQSVCRRLLELDDLNASAHYVLALCRDRSGDVPGAREHDRAAVYLDPTFAMPRLHLGLMARRAGDRAVAQRELSEAMALLEREDASRLVLFGGGFGRAALIGLCRSELLAADGRP